jgi:3-hydroxybutyryl-CoA dehydrogenase
VASRDQPIIGVVGAGTMGAGIAQVALEHGHEVVIHDVDEQAIERGRERIREGLAKRAQKLGLDADSIDEWVDGRIANLRDAETIALLGAEIDFAIEAALEDLELKRDVFRALDAAAPPDATLATNTSALRVASIAEVTSRPKRVIGLHFFTPAPVMPLVEVVAPPGADQSVVVRAAALVQGWGKTAVLSADRPGFIVNRVNRPFTLEALAIVERGEASVMAIDEAMRARGYPMGPLELMDLIGIDVNLAVARALWQGFGEAERFRPSPIQERLVDEGRLGRKSGAGFYRYADGRRGDPVDAAATTSLAAEAIVRRIELAIVAEAYRALEEEVATEADIDLALRLGAGHSMGPFERVRAMGGEAAVRDALIALGASGPRFEVPPGLAGAATGRTSRPA